MCVSMFRNLQMKNLSLNSMFWSVNLNIHQNFSTRPKSGPTQMGTVTSVTTEAFPRASAHPAWNKGSAMANFGISLQAALMPIVQLEQLSTRLRDLRWTLDSLASGMEDRHVQQTMATANHAITMVIQWYEYAQRDQYGSWLRSMPHGWKRAAWTSVLSASWKVHLWNYFKTMHEWQLLKPLNLRSNICTSVVNK